MASGRALKKKTNKRKGRSPQSSTHPLPGGCGTEHSSQEGWIIEGDDCYWSGCGLKRDSFTKVRADALRFLRKVDANTAKDKLLTDWAFALRVVPFAPEETQLPLEKIPEKILTAP
jgi:hypothetical protein